MRSGEMFPDDEAGIARWIILISGMFSITPCNRSTYPDRDLQHSVENHHRPEPEHILKHISIG